MLKYDDVRMLEQGWKNEWGMLNKALGTVRGCRERGRGPFAWSALVLCLVLEWDFMPPVLNIYIQFMTCLSLLGVRTQLQNPIWSEYPEFGYCLLLPYPFNIIYSMFQGIVLKLFCPENILDKDCSVNMYLLTFIYLFFWLWISDHAFLNSDSLPCDIAFFVTFLDLTTLNLKQVCLQHLTVFCSILSYPQMPGPADKVCTGWWKVDREYFQITGEVRCGV